MKSHRKTNPTLKEIKVYYSGSIQGVPEAEPDFAWHLVQYMIEEGVNVLSEHVAGRTKEERDKVRARNLGLDLQEMLPQEEPWFDIRKVDTEWVDEATHMVALVNAPSHGVGMEIERALLKPERGLPETPILCLVHSDVIGKLSCMVKGIRQKDHPNFFLATYNDLAEAKEIVRDFLANTPESKSVSKR
jgi:hypothetical protein